MATQVTKELQGKTERSYFNFRCDLASVFAAQYVISLTMMIYVTFYIMQEAVSCVYRSGRQV